MIVTGKKQKHNNFHNKMSEKKVKGYQFLISRVINDNSLERISNKIIIITMKPEGQMNPKREKWQNFQPVKKEFLEAHPVD